VVVQESYYKKFRENILQYPGQKLRKMNSCEDIIFLERRAKRKEKYSINTLIRAI
jgi:hypothetical protein